MGTKLARQSRGLTSSTTGRPAAYAERLRARINAGKVMGRVQRCALGEEEMTNVEFQAAKLLINKTIPDLPVTPHDPLAGAKDISALSPHALLAQLEAERGDTVTVEPDEQ